MGWGFACSLVLWVGGSGAWSMGMKSGKSDFFFLMKKLSESRKVTQKNASHGISLDKVQLLDCMPISKQKKKQKQYIYILQPTFC